MKPHRQIQSKGKCVALLGAALVLSGVLLLPGNAMAQDIQMSNGGSTASLNLGGGTGNLGMNQWTVLNGQNQLNQQWFWYSINGDPQQSIDTIGTATINNYSSPASPIDDLGVTYANSQLSVGLEYILTGNGVGSGSADMSEYIQIQNMGGTAITLNFYQYSNFNLLQNNDNSVTISGSPGGYTGAVQTTSGLAGNGIAEVIDAPYATRAEAAAYSSTLDSLNSGSFYNLNDVTSALNGDVTWAFQWTTTLAPNGQSGDTLDITKDKGLSIQLIPEPSTLALIGLGLAALGMTLRRKLA